MTQDMEETIAANLFTGGGEMGALMRSLDWSHTSLGHVSGWASSLKTAVSICLNSRFPMVVWWGKELVLLYNDAWRPILGTKHPTALGRPGQEVWSEIWNIIGAQLHSVLETAQATWSDDMLLLVDRYEYIEEAYFTYSYSPIFLETGAVGGAFTAVTETTRRVIGERRLNTLRELAAKTVEGKSVEETCRLASATLANNPYDIPFALLYLMEQDENQACLAGSVGLEAGTPASLEQVDLIQANHYWKLAQVKQTGEPEIVDDMTQFGELPGGVWDEPSRLAIVLPVAQAGQKQLAGLLVLGISPRLAFDDEYRGFCDLVASHVATAIANADAYVAERKRAEALAEINRAKTTFFSNVSHEFRTPLTLMLSPLEELSQTLEERLQPEERETLQLIQRNGLRLQKLVNTLLDFSRIEAGRMQASYEPTDLAAYTAELASMFRSLIERAGMNLVIDCPALPALVYVDRELWEKIVLNLLSNAFKFTFAGSITVQLQAVSNAVSLNVTDTGVGIPEAELPRLFERFHRVSGTPSRTDEGSGIGLALVQEIVKLHGGTIQVSSQLEQGTTFTIALPLGAAHLPSDRIAATRTLTASPTAVTPYVVEAWRWLTDEGSGEWGVESCEDSAPARARVLLADDNADMRDYVKRLLAKQYEVEAVTNGAAALAAIRRQRPDLVLTDVMMPQLDGFELLQALRADPQTKELPIILLSARAGAEARIESLEAGADDYLTKPFSARELLARVDASLKLAQLRQAVNVATQRSEERSRLAIQIAQLGTWRYDPKTDLIELDERVSTIWGEPEETRVLLLSQMLERVHPGDRAQVTSAIEAALDPQSSGAYELDYRIVWNDGTERWLSANGQATFAGKGESRQVVEFLGTALDITDRKQTEASLRKSQVLFEAFMRYSPATAFVKDESGRYLYVNPQAARLCNRSIAEVLGKTDFDIASLAEAQQWREHDLAALAAGHAIETTETLTQADGEHYLTSYKFPIPQPSGQPLIGGISLDETERKRAEMALRDSEEQLRLASEGANLGMWYWHIDNKQLIWTDRAKAMLGLPVETAMTMQVFLKTVHPDDRPFVINIITDLQAGAICTEGEYRTRWADGTVHWIMARGNSSYNADGTLISTRGILMDITDRKRTEQALRDSETRFRFIVESAKDYAILTLDLNGDIISWNSGAQRLLGYTEAEIIGQPGHLIFTTEDHEQGQDELEKHLALMQGRAANERWHVRQDGSRFWGSGLVMPLRDEADRTQGFLKIMQDKTVERQTAQALQEGSDRLKLLYETVSDLLSTEQPMTLMDTLFRKLSAQIDLHCYYHFTVTAQQDRQRLQLMRYDGIAKTDAESLAWIEFGQALCGLVALERRQIVLNQTQIATDPNAQGVCSLGFTAYAGQPLIAQGRLLGTLSFLSRTRTHFTNEEADLLQAISAQVAVAFDRAALVDSLQQQKEQLIQANRLKDEFLAVVSHELRSPLNPILGWSRLLQTQTFDPIQTAHALSIIERNARLQGELINDLLDVSRILQGKLSLKVSPTDLVPTIQAAIETVRLAAEAKAIQLHTLLAPNVGFVSGDSDRLQQVVWNLLSNAVKFTPEGGQVEIRLARLGKQAQITVRDTGKGIVADFLPHVFDYFRQADATTTRTFGGLGLGLAIVRHLTELHGGTVEADSEGEGQGAIFTVRLPLLRDQSKRLSESDTASLLTALPSPLTGISVLIVDDDDSTREFVTFLLELRGARVIAVASAKEALIALTQCQPTILLSDIGMPEMDGYMLLRQIRTLPPEQGGQIPAIALTAYAGEINYQQAMLS
ncbi:MAG: ATP-binding protein [Stenomitos frigidus ULC029]